MRIQGTGAPDAVEGTRATARTGGVAELSAGDEVVSVSTRAQQLSSTQASSQTARAAKLASLKSQIAAGSYRVDKHAVASRMADEELARAGVS